MLQIEVKIAKNHSIFYRLTREDGSVLREDAWEHPPLSGGEGAVLNGIEFLTGILLQQNEAVNLHNSSCEMQGYSSSLVEKIVDLHNKRFEK